MPKSPTTNEPVRFVATDGRYAGRECWLFPQTGKVFPIVRGGDGSGEGAAGGVAGEGGSAVGAGEGAAAGAAGEGAAASAASGDAKLTQADVDKQIEDRLARERAKIAKDLGMSVADAKKLAAERQQQIAAEADEKTKRETAESERDAARADAKRVERDAAIRIAVADSGAGADEKDDAKRSQIRADIAVLVTAKLGDNAEPSAEDVATALTAVKDLHAGLFEVKKGTSGTGTGVPVGGGGAKDDFEQGAALGKAERERDEKRPVFMSGLEPLGARAAS